MGHDTCVPVGWTAPCPAGFVADPSGWGCTDRTPATACAGAARESVSSDASLPVGDCNAAFPPAGALQVDAAFTPAQIDAAHFLTISAAVAAAPFVESSQAAVRGSKVSATNIGADGKWGWGLAAGLGSQVSVDDSLIAGGTDGIFAGSAGTVVNFHRSVLARQTPSGTNRSSGVRAGDGAKIVLTQSVVRDVEGDGAVVSDTGGHIDVTECVLRGTRVKGSVLLRQRRRGARARGW